MIAICSKECILFSMLINGVVNAESKASDYIVFVGQGSKVNLN